MQRDIEKDAVRVHYIDGFASLADAIASDNDHSTAIYKPFDRLGARDLLYMQSELAELEALQMQYDREDADLALDPHHTELVRECAMSWAAFEREAKHSQDDRVKKRMVLALKIRGRLKEYREALVLSSAILSLRTPSSQAYRASKGKFWNEVNGEPQFATLRGPGARVYDEKDELVALRRPEAEDRLTVFLRNHCSFLFATSPHIENESWRYFSARRISTAASVVTVVLAAAFLFGAIYNLYTVHDDQIKLGLITCYTTAFAATVALVTNAKRSEIFGACAAYAAVLVVFVSGDLGGDNTSPQR